MNPIETRPLKDHFLEISEFLSPYHDWYTEEPLLHYPQHISKYPQSWINYLKNLFSQEDAFFRFTGNGELNLALSDNNCPEDFKYYIQRIVQLRQVPKRERLENPKLPGLRLEGITHKKLHEINQIFDFLMQEFSEDICPVDLCSGKGHLSFLMGHEKGIKTLNIDFDSELQYAGELRNTKYFSSHFGFDENPVSFKTLDLRSLNSKILKEHDPILGLHTCGGLSKLIFEKSVESNAPNILNFGCCYYKMIPSDYQISTLGQEMGLINHLHTLSLATRSHGRMSANTFKMNNNVKFHRYIFQLLLNKEFNHDMKTVLKSSKASLYRGSFSEYASVQFKRLKIEHNFSEKDLNDFYHDSTNQEIVVEMLCANAIRNLLGRILELYLILDRGLYLEERGYKVLVQEFFDEDLSPRNLGIFATKRS